MGDRIGRRPVLAATILLMGMSSTLIGLLPTYSQVGLWAPAMLVVLRLMQGLGAGAEQAGASVLMTEYAPVGRRGFFASLPFLGVQLGAIAAPLVFFGLSGLMQSPQRAWLWRVPFLVSVGIVGVALWIRLRLKETPTFAGLEARRQVARSPLRDLIAHSRRTLLLGISLRVAEIGGSSIYQVLAISYLVKVVGLKSSLGTMCLLLAAMVGALVVPVAGWLTDRLGRIRTYRFFAVLQLLLTFPVWWVLSLGEFWASAVALGAALGVATWGMYGAGGALLPELFGARRRYIGVAVTREVSAVLAGGTAPLLGSILISWSATTLGGGQRAWLPIAAYASVLSLITVVATCFAPEPGGRDLSEPEDVSWR
jgi:MHS family metabolite:H+ symporter-like MFS transporter